MEQNLKMVAIAVVLVSIISVSYLGFQNAMNPRVLPTVHYEEVDQGYYCGIREKVEYVIDNNESWGILWTEMHNISTSTPHLPSVDFQNEVVIAVFIGEFSTGGYSANIKRIEYTTGGYIVHVDEIHPGEGCGLTMALTQPYHIVKANLTITHQVEFVYTIVIDDCS